MRAVALPEVPNPTWAVILDMPLSTTIEERIQQETGIRIGEITRASWPAACRRSPGARSKIVPLDDGRRAARCRCGRRAGWCSSITSTGTPARPRARRSAIVINTFEIYDRISVVSPVGLGGN